MGAWSAESFGNDTACDWVCGLKDAEDLGLVRETLQQVVEVGEEYLDSDPACQALAACEIIARLKGNGGAPHPDVDEWVASHPTKPPANLVATALAVIDRILTPPSELLELWQEADDTRWRNAVQDLRDRVSR